MSYEAWGEPDDDDLGERAGEAGYLDPDTVDQLRKLLNQVEMQTRPGNKSDAALVMIEHLLNPPQAIYFVEGGIKEPIEDPNVTWAKILLKDVL